MGELIRPQLTVEEAKELARLRLLKAIYGGAALRPRLERRYRSLSARGSAADRFRVAI